MMGRLEKGYVLPGQTEAIYECRKILARMGSLRTVLLSTLSYNSAHIAVKSKYSMMGQQHAYLHGGDFQLLVKELTGWKNSGYRLILVCRSETRGKRLVKDLAEYDLLAFLFRRQGPGAGAWRDYDYSRQSS